MRCKVWLRIIVLCSFFSQLGCSAVVYRMASLPSPTETGKFSGSEIYQLSDFPDSITLSGIELDTYLFNTRTLRGYETSLIVPIPTKQVDSDMGDIGRVPFVVNLRMRVEGEGATFNPFSTELHIEGSDKTIFPNEVFRDRAKLAACGYHNMPSSVGVEVTESIVHVFNKFVVLTKKGEENEDWSAPHWTCIQFRFNVPTPDPSKKFWLKLGEIVKPNGEHIRPTIYFSPATYRTSLH